MNGTTSNNYICRGPIRDHLRFYKASALHLESIYHDLTKVKAYAFYVMLKHQYRYTMINCYKQKYHEMMKLTGIGSVNTVKKYIQIIIDNNWGQIETGRKGTHLKLFSYKTIGEGAPKWRRSIRKCYSIEKTQITNLRKMEDWFTLLMVIVNQDRQKFSNLVKRKALKSSKKNAKKASMSDVYSNHLNKLHPTVVQVLTFQSQRQLQKQFNRSYVTVNRRLIRAEKSKVLIQRRSKNEVLMRTPISPGHEYLQELGKKHKGHAFFHQGLVLLKKSSQYIPTPQIDFEPSAKYQPENINGENLTEFSERYLRWCKECQILDDNGRFIGYIEWRKLPGDNILSKEEIEAIKTKRKEHKKKWGHKAIPNKPLDPNNYLHLRQAWNDVLLCKKNKSIKQDIQDCYTF